MSSKDFASAWNEKLPGQGERIDESTINRWKKGTLPRPYYLPRIIKVLAVINAEHAASGFPQVLDHDARDRLNALRVREGTGRDGASRAPAVETDAEGFLAGILEAAYSAQKGACDEGREPAAADAPAAGDAPVAAAAPAAARKGIGIPAAGVTFALAIGILLFAVFDLSGQRGGGSESRQAGSRQSGSDGGASLTRAMEAGDEAEARRLFVSGAKVDVEHFKGNAARIDALARVCQGAVSPFSQSGRIDASVGGWGVYWGGDLPRFSMDRASPDEGPKDGDDALRLSLLGGDPYSFAHFYSNLTSRPARRFAFSLRFYLDGDTALSDKESSIVQALEFSLSRYEGRKRCEIAWQWENVGEGGPQWRYWDPPKGWVAAGITAGLSPRTWHELAFSGSVAGDGVRYESFSLDGKDIPFSAGAALADAPDASDYLAVAVQLDGNFRSDPYDLYIKDLSLRTAR